MNAVFGKHARDMITSLCLATFVLSTSAAAQEGTAEKTLDERIDALRVKVRDTYDPEATKQLAELRIEEKRQRAEAAENLRRGLQAYLRKDFLAAGVDLRKAMRSRSVVQFADCFLLKSVKATAEECPEQTPASTDPEAKPCSTCGDTGAEDCKSCNGTGNLRCSKCSGKGIIRVRPRSGVRLPRGMKYLNMACPKCGGTGVVPCAKCAGTGLLPCHVCTRKGVRDEPGELGPNALEAVKKVICMTRYLRQGGIDLYSTEALRPSSAALKKP